MQKKISMSFLQSSRVIHLQTVSLWAFVFRNFPQINKVSMYHNVTNWKNNTLLLLEYSLTSLGTGAVITKGHVKNLYGFFYCANSERARGDTQVSH